MINTLLTNGSGIDWPSEIPVRPEGEPFFTEGERATFLVEEGGSLVWSEKRWGIYNTHAESQLVATARQESLLTAGIWINLIGWRCAVPVFGNRWRSGMDWTLRQPGWAIGLIKGPGKILSFSTTHPLGFQDEGGAALISEQDGERRRLILFDGPTAVRWLFAKQWEARDMLEDTSLRLGEIVES